MSLIIKRIDFDPEFQPVLLSPVIGHRSLSALDQAKTILRQAREESLRIRQEADHIRQEASLEREAEKERGFEEGRQEGLGRLTEKILEVAAAQENFFRGAETEVIRMVMDIAEKVIARELKKGAVTDIVRQAVGRAVGQKVIVRVHPQDAVRLKEKEPEILQAAGSRQSLVVREDEEIPPGGCIVESELGTVDARLETQLSAIRKALGIAE